MLLTTPKKTAKDSTLLSKMPSLTDRRNVPAGALHQVENGVFLATLVTGSLASAVEERGQSKIRRIQLMILPVVLEAAGVEVVREVVEVDAVDVVVRSLIDQGKADV